MALKLAVGPWAAGLETPHLDWNRPVGKRMCVAKDRPTWMALRPVVAGYAQQ